MNKITDQDRELMRDLSKFLETMFKKYGDNDTTKLMIANYVVGYTGVRLGLSI